MRIKPPRAPRLPTRGCAFPRCRRHFQVSLGCSVRRWGAEPPGRCEPGQRSRPVTTITIIKPICSTLSAPTDVRYWTGVYTDSTLIRGVVSPVSAE